MDPFKPVERCRLNFKPPALSAALVKASCSLKVLLDTTLTLLVVEKRPPRFTAYARIVLVPATNSTVDRQLAHPLVVVVEVQAPLLT